MPSADDMRVASLRALDVLDSEPEPVFDAIVRLASTICGTPISLISLVDAQRQWFKARSGLEGVTETERAVAFCSHTIEQDEMLLVHDALHDPRFAANPLVTGAPGIRFYAGIPLALRDGSRCGTLCVIDQQPRTLSPHQVELLTELAKVAAWALEARRALGREAQNTQTLDAGHAEASALLDLDGRIRSWNAAAEYLLELPAAEVLGRSASDFVRPEHAVELNEAIAEVRAAGHGRHYVTTRVHPSGRTLRLLERLTPVRDDSGQVMAIRQVMLKAPITSIDAVREPPAAPVQEPSAAPVSSFSERRPTILVVDDDPAAIRVMAAALQDQAQILFATRGADALSLAHSALPDLIMLDGEMPGESGIEVCRKLKASEQVAGIPVVFVTAHDTAAFETEAMQAGAADFLTKPVRRTQLQLRAKLHLERKKQLERLMALSKTDTLTAIANRRAFDERLDHEWRRSLRSGAPLSLLLIDVDYFKLFNDSLGHRAGDDCLRAVAAAIQSTLRRPGDLAARFGGEEFAVLLPDTANVGAGTIGEAARQAILHARIAHPASPIAPFVTVSIGVASRERGHHAGRDAMGNSLAPFVAQSGQVRLVDLADRALYQAKHAGRNRVVLHRQD